MSLTSLWYHLSPLTLFEHHDQKLQIVTVNRNNPYFHDHGSPVHITPIRFTSDTRKHKA